LRVLGLLIASLLFSPVLIYRAASAVQESVVYYCSMHPEVQSSKPGNCPKCEMRLVAKKPEDKRSNAPESAPGAGQESTPPTPAPRKELIQQVESYTCSMHPEIRAEGPGKCPKCEMTLVPIVPGVPEDFDLKIECTPKAPKVNEKVRLRFSVFNPRTGEQVRQFNIMHEQLFHLFVVSADMTEFQHIHPDIQPDGSFVIETVLPVAGPYKLYSDFYPNDGTPQVLQRGLVTAGFSNDLLAAQASLTPDTSLTKVADGMKIELKLEPPELIAGQPVELKYHMTDAKTGEPVKDLVPYLGAWGHTLILSEDQSDYVHSHPEEDLPPGVDATTLRGGPEVIFSALIPRAGSYRIWTQFLRGGRLTTVSFTVQARRLQ
jgi:hypothetical protein